MSRPWDAQVARRLLRARARLSNATGKRASYLSVSKNGRKSATSKLGREQRTEHLERHVARQR
jgi:hypothetical protein